MSLRLAKKPITLPSGVEAKLDNNSLTIKGGKATLSKTFKLSGVDISIKDQEISVGHKGELTKFKKMMLGTICSNITNMIEGVTKGYEKKLVLVGVGYKAQMKGKNLSLNLGLSHPVEFTPPEGITIESPSQTEIVIKGCNKDVVGQVAANIRKYRPPEPYKGKGILYFGEVIIKKETKKK